MRQSPLAAAELLLALSASPNIILSFKNYVSAAHSHKGAANCGGPLRRSTFRRNVWLPTTTKMGLTGLRPDDLRHTAVALAIAEGAHPVAIQKRLGHADVATPLGLYGHLFPSLDAQIADRMDATRTRVSAERHPGAWQSPSRRSRMRWERVMRPGEPMTLDDLGALPGARGTVYDDSVGERECCRLRTRGHCASN